MALLTAVLILYSSNEEPLSRLSHHGFVNVSVFLSCLNQLMREETYFPCVLCVVLSVHVLSV